MLAGLPVLTHLAVNSSTDLDVYVYFFSVRKSLDALILPRRPRVSGSAELDILCDNPRRGCPEKLTCSSHSTGSIL